MKRIDPNKLALAERFIWLSARVLERRRFERLFKGGAAEPVLAALAAYQNPDGGFGQAIEPDFRGPISQPLGADSALRVLSELGSVEPRILDGLLSFLVANTAADGGLPNVLPSATAYPRAPWWQPASADPGGCLLPTASVAGLLHQLGVEHPWLERAGQFCWAELARIAERAQAAKERIPRLQVAYEARAALVFLDHVPARARAEEAAAGLGRALASAGLISVDDPAAEATLALDYAHGPQTLSRRWFDERLIEQELDRLVDTQAADGGWTVPWQIWTPVTEHEWRGLQTLERLKTLRAFGRLAQ